MILGHSDFVRAWKSGKIAFSPNIEPDQIGLSSIDLRLGYEFSKLQRREGITVNPSLDEFDPKGLYSREDYRTSDNLGKPRPFKLDTHEFVVGLLWKRYTFPAKLPPV